MLFVYNFITGCSENNRENCRGEDAFEWKKKKPGLNLNLGLAPIGLQTTKFVLIFSAQKGKSGNHKNISLRSRWPNG